jgi:hypothetical protein
MNLAPQLRLELLLILKEAGGYEANTSVLQSALGMIGYQVSRQVVRDQILWLAEQGLVSHEVLAAEALSIDVATLTERGLDVAAGREIVEGVQRPAPRG